MKQIIKWQAEDGSEFTDMAECLSYESLCAQVADVMAAFPPKPENDGCSFSNGGGFLQLSEAVVKDVRLKLLDIVATKISHRWVDESRDMRVDASYVDRLLGDYGIRPLCRAWSRISCIDKQWREWGQPFFANNPGEGTQKMLGSV